MTRAVQLIRRINLNSPTNHDTSLSIMYNRFANGEHRDRRPENLLDFAKQQVLHGHNRPDGQSGPLSTIFCDFCDDDDATLISDIVQGGDTDLT